MISIITVCYNSASTIEQTFDSVLRQDYANDLEYIVVDGSSTDGTVQLIRHYEGRFVDKGTHFRWISERDDGIYDAMNKGLRMATGGIVGILNSDDYYERNTLQTVADANSIHPEVGIFYGFLRVMMSSGDELQTVRYNYENYLLNPESGIFAGTQHPTCFVKSDVYERIGVFDTKFSIAADYDFLVRAMRAGVTFRGLDKVLCNFRLDGASDRMSDFERFKQRDAVMFKNGLLSASEYASRRQTHRYQRYKSVKARLVQYLLRLQPSKPSAISKGAAPHEKL